MSRLRKKNPKNRYLCRGLIFLKNVIVFLDEEEYVFDLMVGVGKGDGA